MTFSHTRKVLWERRQRELLDAQNYDRECLKLEGEMKQLETKAAECRSRAAHLQLAAETLEKLDEGK